MDPFPPRYRGILTGCPSAGRGYFAFPSSSTSWCRRNDRIFRTSWANILRMHKDRHEGSWLLKRPLTVCVQYVMHHSSVLGEKRPVNSVFVRIFHELTVRNSPCGGVSIFIVGQSEKAGFLTRWGCWVGWSCVDDIRVRSRKCESPAVCDPDFNRSSKYGK